ncbi:hypothetical protein ACFWEH_35950 [Streptomyces anulatus]|uniref:hypothetical protein n=1 Tax=Streptomyces TaxID=1883 RepID=UPI0011613DC9|nr:hypothetical protein [Streptomyces sp. TSRI0395]
MEYDLPAAAPAVHWTAGAFPQRAESERRRRGRPTTGHPPDQQEAFTVVQGGGNFADAEAVRGRLHQVRDREIPRPRHKQDQIDVLIPGKP